MSTRLSADDMARVAAVTGLRPVGCRPVEGGYTNAERHVVGLADGSSVFVKMATDALTARWLRDERMVYEEVQAEFLPRFVGWSEGERPILILEDLSGGVWSPSWSRGNVERVLATLDRLAETALSSGFPSLDGLADEFMGWRTIAGDPSGFLSLGLTSADWLETALPTLAQAEASAWLKGESLVHGDIRSDNICFLGTRTLLVDWNWARRGNPKVDLIAWLPSLPMEAGPPPWEFTVAEPELIAAVAGYHASRAYLPPPPHPRGLAIRRLQLAQLEAALPWAARALGLSPPA